RELVPRELVLGKPSQLGEVVGRTRYAARACNPRQAQNGPAVVRLVPEPEEAQRLDLEARFLTDLPPQSCERLFALVEEAAGQVPVAGVRLEPATAEQDSVVVVEHDRFRARHRIRIRDETARGALETPCVTGERRCAARAILPIIKQAHERTI